MKLRIEPNGDIKMIYSDTMIGLFDEGQASTKRASNVEPVPGGWAADLAPVNGPTLGPFKLRSEALAAEVAWLEENILYVKHEQALRSVPGIDLHSEVAEELFGPEFGAKERALAKGLNFGALYGAGPNFRK